MVDHTQRIFRQFADELFECIWPFCGIGAWSVKNVAKITTKTPFLINLLDKDLRFYWKDQGRSQNLKPAPQNFMEVFKVDDVKANDIIQKKQHRLRKEKLQISHISIFSIKLLKKTWNLVFISKGITSQFQYFLDWNLYDDFTVRSSN